MTEPFTLSTILYQLPAQAVDGLAAVVAVLRAATTTLDLELFEFTHPILLNEVAAAAKRGVRVRLMLEHTEAGTPAGVKALHGLILAGVPATAIRITTSEVAHQLAHKKLGIVDGQTVIEGSTNWSLSAFEERNQLLVIHDAGYAATVTESFEAHWSWTAQNEAAYQTVGREA